MRLENGSPPSPKEFAMLHMRTLLRIASHTAAALLVAFVASADDASSPSSERGPSQIGFLFVNYYHSDLAELESRATWISEYDLAVALHLVRASGIELDEIVAWRREGSSWDAITRRCGLGCEIYFVELTAETALAEPYARPYLTWDARPGADQRLSDVEVRELVLLRAMSDYLRASADEVVTLRTAGQSPKAIAAMHPPRQRAGSVSAQHERLAPPSAPSAPDPDPGDEQ